MHVSPLHSKIKIKAKVLDFILKHAEITSPQECCGFLYGQVGEIRSVQLARAVPNSHPGDKKVRFTVHPKDYIQAERFASASGMALLGVYHSHPRHPAVPSEEDLKFAHWGFSYIIVSLQEGISDRIRSWFLNSDDVFEEACILKI